MRRRIGSIEELTFEETSEDGAVTAVADGKVRLVELRFATEACPAASLIEAINAAIGTAQHRRSCAMMVLPGG